MENNKRYYWIKLKTDFFNREEIDFMLSQDNGFQYVVLYQMLCLNTANNNGRLETKINEVIVPYDIKKIVRDTKYFDFDTVAVALELYKTLGLIYEEENNILKISNYEDLIGSETIWAEKKRIYRENQKLLKDNVMDNVREEYRDKSIDIRYIDNKNNKKENIKRKSFTKPTIEEIEQYCLERKNGINANAFYDFYESKDWMVGKNKMKDWKACVRTWEQRNSKNKIEAPSWINQNFSEKREEILTEEDYEWIRKFEESNKQ